MLTMYLVRHGETEENRNNVLQGQTPGHLTELGKQQARELGAKLKNIDFDAVISSPLQRAVDTTRIILDEGCTNKSNQMELCELLQERDWGSLTLWPYAKVRQLNRFPDDVETLEDGMERGRQFVNLMLEKYDGKRILCVGHGFIDRCILSMIYGVDKSNVPRMENAECRVVEICAMIPKRTYGAMQDEASAN